MSTTPATIEVRVARKANEAIDICSFELVHPGGERLPPFSAGSHVDVVLGDGLSRQYSLCNDPREAHRYLIAVLRDPASRGGSAAMHDKVKEGDLLRISEPKNHFPLAHGARHTLLLAGGIGVTPVLCMAERLANTGQRFEMHYCARSPNRMAFKTRIKDSAYARHVHLHFDDGAPEQKLDLAQLLASPSPDTHLYVCGPTGFLSFVRDTAKAQGWSTDCVHFEYFTPAARQASVDAAFDVMIASTRKVYVVPEGRSITSVLAEQGLDIPVSCEQGVCGTCLTRVLEGEPEHRDSYMTDEEHARNDQLTPCCSRAKSPLLVLDL